MSAGIWSYDGFSSLDWGFNARFACYWWSCLPDGRLYIRREWSEREVWAEDFAERFWKITREDLAWSPQQLRYVVAGGDIKARSGLRSAHGESVKETLQSHGLPIVDADKDRIPGWYRMHELLRPSPFGTPWLIVDPSCKYLIRTIAAAPRDPKNEDELDPKFTDDHGLESVRYGAMSRPSPTQILRELKVQDGSVGQMLQDIIAANNAAAGGVLGASAVRRSA